ncbi:hypothetical protein RhiJN_00740 [Ceratobasidium sp. AG-Ba]|nr:hypothetical protein RhiJN_00740 [Ceratobasidium sp. AG-Ba]
MSRANSVERERKPLPPVPPAQNTLSVAESTQTSTTDRFAQTLKKMSEDIPTTEYRSPLNLAGRIKNELADLTREIVVAPAVRSTTDNTRPAPPTAADHRTPAEVESITSAEKIRRNWEESQRSPDRHPQGHKSRPSRDPPRYRTTTVPPTAFRPGDGGPWTSHSQDHSRSRHPEDSHSHRRERSEEELRDVEVYGHSDESEPQTPVLEIHNATPIHERGEMKAKGRPGLTSRFRTSLQRIGVGSTRPAKQRADISRSPSPDRGSRSPSPHTWRKPSPHSSIRANDQYATPHATKFPDALPRIESQRMDLDWGEHIDRPQTPPQRPTAETLPSIPDLHSPGIHLENGPRAIPIIDGDKLRSTGAREHIPVHHVEKSDATTATAVNPPSQREYFHDDDLVLHNIRGHHDVYEGRDIVPGRLKRLLSLSGRTVPIDGPDSPVSGSPPSAPRPKVSTSPAGIIRSASLIRTRSRRKESSKPQERRAEPEVVHVDYESDGWGESPPVVRDAQGRIIPAATPKRRGSLKNKTTGPTKIALPMGQVEEFHSVHSNSPTEAAPKDLVSGVPMLRSEHKRTTSTTTFHTAQSETTRPNTPARKLSNSSTRQAKTSGASESKHEGWRRSRAGAPRRPSQTILATTTGVTENQYADEEPVAHDTRVLPGHESEHRHTDRRGHHQESSDSYFPPQPIPIVVHRSRSPASQDQIAYSPPVHGPPSVLPHDASNAVRHPPGPTRTPPPQRPPPDHSPPPVPNVGPPTPPSPPHPPARASSPPPLDPRSRSPPPLLEPGQSYTPPPRHSLHASPEPSPPIQTPRIQTTPLENQEVHILPVDNPTAEHHPYEAPRYQSHIETQVEPVARSSQLDTPYVLPRMPTPTLTSPGVLLDRPSPTASPMIDRSAPSGPRTPPRSIHIEDPDEVHNPSLSERPLPRPVAEISGVEQQRRSQNRKTGSEMSFVTVEPLSKREKLAASMLSISSMPWLRGRLSSSRSQPYAESSYHSNHDDDDSRYHDRYDRHERHRQHPDYVPSPTVPQLPPMTHSPPPRPEVGKLPSWYPREQAARAAASSPLARDSRGPKIGQEAWGWRSSPDPHRFGIPEEPEENEEASSQPVTMPPWPYAGGVVTPGPNIPNDVVRGESMMTPPILPPRPAVPSSEATPRASGEKKRMPKYRIEQDDRGYPVLVPEPGFDDSRWTVFEIGGVQFKRAPGATDGAKGAQWVPNRLSGRRPDSHLSPLAHQYSDSPAPMHTALDERHHNA